MAANFPGTGSDNLTVTLGSGVNVFGVQFWLWLDANNVEADIFSFKAATQNQWMGIRVGGNLAIWSGTTWDPAVVVISTGVWHQVRLAQNADVLYLYLDGVYQNSFNGYLTGKTDIVLGSQDTESFDGKIANVQLWGANYVDEDAERTRYIPARYDTLLGWWPLISDAVDYSGSGNNFSVAGSVTYADGPPLTWGAPVWMVGLGAVPPSGSIIPLIASYNRRRRA